MEEQLRKLKNKSVIVFVLTLLAATWQFLNYLTVQDHIKMDDFSSIDVILIYSSYLFLILLILAVFSLIYTVFRVNMKYKSDKKKEEKEKVTPKTISEDSTKL